jgi:hypothetical protein
MKISKYFRLEEFLQSQYAARHGIDMTPSPAVARNLTALAVNVLDPLRDRAGCPIIITSGFRPTAVNVGIGGSATSQHVFGEAADIRATKINPYNLCQMIVNAKLPFDQLIYEFGDWTHVSFRKGRLRGEVLTAKRVNGKTKYLPGLVR